MKFVERIYIILLPGLLLMYGCAGDMPDPKYVINIEGEEFRCFVNEDVKKDTLDLIRVNFSTIDGSYCETAMLSGSSSIHPDMIQFNLHHIDQNQDCSLPQHNPSRNLNAGYLEEGDYNVQLAISQSVYYQGKLSVTDELLKIEFYDAPTLNVYPDPTFRIPDGTVWMRLHFLPKDADEVMECKDRIEAIAKDHSFEDGYYSYFDVENGEVNIFRPNESPNLESSEGLFVLNDTDSATVDSMLTIVRSYLPVTNHQFYVFLKTWHGQEYLIE